MVMYNKCKIEYIKCLGTTGEHEKFNIETLAYSYNI